MVNIMGDTFQNRDGETFVQAVRMPDGSFRTFTMAFVCVPGGTNQFVVRAAEHIDDMDFTVN